MAATISSVVHCSAASPIQISPMVRSGNVVSFKKLNSQICSVCCQMLDPFLQRLARGWQIDLEGVGLRRIGHDHHAGQFGQRCRHLARARFT